MNPEKPAPAAHPNPERSTWAPGRTVSMRRAQDQLRQQEAARQAAILDALPAHGALLDAQGVIVSVNAMWRQFADTNVLQSPGHGVGVNYLAVCERASGTNAPPLELLRQRPDGSPAWVELRRHALRSGKRWTIITLAYTPSMTAAPGPC